MCVPIEFSVLILNDSKNWLCLLTLMRFDFILIDRLDFHLKLHVRTQMYSYAMNILYNNDLIVLLTIDSNGRYLFFSFICFSWNCVVATDFRIWNRTVWVLWIDAGQRK